MILAIQKFKTTVYWFLINSFLLQLSTGDSIVEDQDYWHKLNEEDLGRALKYKPNTNVAKNVVLFIGDGMGLATVTAARIYAKSEREFLAFEKMPNIAAIKTYSANKYVPDSSSTATAMFSGVKANQKTTGVDASVQMGDCKASLSETKRPESIATWAQRAGKRTGFVTTTRVTHATPSALYAHTPNRKWECEATMPREAAACKDIARQLIEDLPGRDLNVIMGGGRQELISHVKNNTANNDPIDTWACYSRDGRNLTGQWVEDKLRRKLFHKYVRNSGELDQVTNETDYLLGIFANGHMNMDHERKKGRQGMPSLTNMTAAALKVIMKDPKGFLLMIEGGLIDFAHHRGKAKKALSETKAFSDAIEYTLKTVNLDDTLVIVTSDHSQPMVISGYADRGTKITGIAQKSKADGRAYTTLLYGIGGPDNYKYKVVDSKRPKVAREDPETVDTDSFEYAQQAGVMNDETTHDGSDVLVYAQGPMAHLFHSVHEQTYVAHVIAYAAKIGPYSNRSDPSDYYELDQGEECNKSPRNVFNYCPLILATAFLFFIL